MVLSLLYSPVKESAINIFFRLIFLDISIFYIIYVWVNNLKKIKRLLYFFSGICITYGIIILGLGLGGKIITSEVSIVPAFTYYTTVGLLLTISIFLIVVLEELSHSKLNKIAIIFLSMLCTIALVAINARGPLVAFFFGIIFLLYFSNRVIRKKYLVNLFALIGVVFLAFLVLPERYTIRHNLLFDLQSDSIAERFLLWRFVWDHFGNWFITGAGLLGFPFPGVGFYGGLSFEISDYLSFGGHPHNLFLDVFVRMGFIGTLLFSCFVGNLIKTGVKLLSVDDNEYHVVLVATFTAVCIFLVDSLFNASLLTIRPLWFFGGIILAMEHIWWKSDTKNIRNVE
jgi:O-antigen ligase